MANGGDNSVATNNRDAAVLNTSRIVAADPLRDGAPYERDELLHEMFDEVCTKPYANLALRLIAPDQEFDRRTELTYLELQDRSLQFARHLRNIGISRGDRVVICLPRGLDQYMAILGILRAGACYVPVDWAYPQDRIDFIAEDSDAKLVVTLREKAHLMPVPALPLDEMLGELATYPVEMLGREDTGGVPDDLAYLIYTSGTTGRPKGVMISHRNACHLVRSESAILGIDPQDKVFGAFSLAFDMSVETMWSAFFVGATLLVGTEALSQAGPDMAQVLAMAGVTVWHVVPSLLSLVDDEVPSLRLLNLGGEACPPELVDRWARPGLRMLNTYGPTETTVTATWTELFPGNRVTIGRPLPGYDAWIVDENLMPVPAGAEGELVIGGPGVSAGYVGRPELTAEKFVLAPFAQAVGLQARIYRSGDLVRLDSAGNIEFLGRIDTQVKIRGFRVELGEIEAVLADDPAVAQAVVNLVRNEHGEDLLAAYLVARAGRTIDLEAARDRVQERLPNYMRPAAYEVLPALPTLPASGKVDRKSLPQPEFMPVAERELVEPETPTEQVLHLVWTEVLAPQKVSVLDDLFDDLGGHSLKAARLASAIRKQPGMSGVSIQDIYAAPTIRALAERIGGRASEPGHEMPDFHRVPASKRLACQAAQTLALIPIYTIAGLQWFFPYLAYTYLASDDNRLKALLLSGLSFIFIPPLAMAISVLVKWLVIGRYRPGSYPLWGSYYFRWWLVRRFAEVIATPYMAGTPMIRVFYRLLGARVGKGAFIGRATIDAADLVTIGDEAIVSDEALLATSSVERGMLHLGPVAIGAGAFVGSRAVVGRNATLGIESGLDDLSSLPADGAIPAGELWNGSPARPAGRSQHTAGFPPVSRSKSAAVDFVLLILALLLPVMALLPIAPGLVMLIEMDWRSEGYSYLAITPFLALTYVVLMCTLTIFAKHVIMGQVIPGRYALKSWFYARFWFVQQINDLALRLVHPIYATLYVLPWYRGLGMKVGRRAEISTASALVPDLVEIGPESFIADDVRFGAAQIERGAIRLDWTRIGRRSFIGNSALLPTGTTIGDEVLIGVLSTPPAGNRAATPGGTWFGSPPISLPTRQVVGMFDEGARFNPPTRLVVQRLSIEFVRVILSLTVFLALFGILLSVVGTLDEMNDSVWFLAGTFPFLYVAFALGCGLFGLALKWLVMGRYRATTKPLWSTFVWRTELVTATYENLVVPNFLDPLRGTPWLPLYWRLLGCKVGRRCYIDTTDVTEPDLIEIGDDVAINDFSGLQTHLFEDRVMKVGKVVVNDRASIGSYCVVLYDAEIGEDCMLGDLSVVMKGESLPAGTNWEGSPAASLGGTSRFNGR